MVVTDDQALAIYTRKNFKKKENFHHKKKKDKKLKKTKRDLSNVRCYTRDEKGHWKEIFPSRKRDTILIISKMMNQQTKYSNERRMIQMKSMWSFQTHDRIQGIVRQYV